MIDIDVSKIISEIGEPRARLIENEDDKRQREITIISSFVFLFLFLCGTITFFILSNMATANSIKLAEETKNIEESNKYLLKNESDAQEIIRRNGSIAQILNNNANWSYVFERLEKVIPKGIIFNDFAVISKSDMQISGTSPDYVELSKLVVAMKNSENLDIPKNSNGLKNFNFNNVNLTSASLKPATEKEPQSVQFDITFGFTSQFNRGALQPKNTTIEDSTIPESSESTPLPSDTGDGGGINLPVPEEGTSDTETQPTPEVPVEGGGENTLPVL